MELSPGIYRRLVRPRILTKIYIENILNERFDLQDKKVLDFGCGVGAISNMFLPQNYLGIDSDIRRVDYARKLNQGYNFKVISGNKLPVQDNSVESIIIIAVLHHIPSDTLIDYLQEFKRVLKFKGNVLVIEPCLFENSSVNNWFMECFDNGKYIRTENDYLTLFEDHGFKTSLCSRYKKIFYNEIFFSAVPGFTAN